MRSDVGDSDVATLSLLHQVVEFSAVNVVKATSREHEHVIVGTSSGSTSLLLRDLRAAKFSPKAGA